MSEFKSTLFKDGTPTGRDSDGYDVNGHRWPHIVDPNNPGEFVTIHSDGSTTGKCSQCDATFTVGPQYVDPADMYLKRKMVQAPPAGPCPKRLVA